MGFLDSWVAVKGGDRNKLREFAGLEETDDRGWAIEAARPFSYADFPGGWTVIFSNDFEWASDARVKELSRFGQALGCRLNDKVEAAESVVFAAEGGRELWRVSAYDYDLTATGALPPQYQAIRTEWITAREAKGEDAEVHEIPVELAKAICGFRADDDQPDFTGLKPLKGGWASRPIRDEPDIPRRAVRGRSRLSFASPLIWVGWLAIFLLIVIIRAWGP